MLAAFRWPEGLGLEAEHALNVLVWLRVTGLFDSTGHDDTISLDDAALDAGTDGNAAIRFGPPIDSTADASASLGYHGVRNLVFHEGLPTRKRNSSSDGGSAGYGYCLVKST